MGLDLGDDSPSTDNARGVAAKARDRAMGKGQMRRFFTSRHIFKVDKKGRVSVPASYRAVIGGDADNQIVYLRRNRKDGALDGMTEDYLVELASRIDPLDMRDDKRDAVEDDIFAESTDVKFDPDGRMVLSAELRECAVITDTAAFVGLGRRFQIWNPDAYEARKTERQEVAQSVPLRPASANGGGA